MHLNRFPLKPASSSVGIAAQTARALRDVIASARSFPSLMSGQRGYDIAEQAADAAFQQIRVDRRPAAIGDGRSLILARLSTNTAQDVATVPTPTCPY